MDQYDEDEPEPEARFFDANERKTDSPTVILPGTATKTTVTPPKDPSFHARANNPYMKMEPLPVKPEDTLTMSNHEIPCMTNPKFKWEGKKSYKEVTDMEPIGELGEVPKTDVPARKSSRETKPVERWGFQGARKINSIIKAGVIGISCFALQQYAQEANQAIVDIKNEVANVNTLEVKSVAEIAEETFVYHSRLHAIKMLDYESDDWDDHIWTPEEILEHRVKKREGCKTPEIKLKIKFKDDEKSWVQLHDLKMQEPMMCIKYALEKDLLHKPGWEWVPSLVKEDERMAGLNRLILAVQTAPKYKFGTEVPKSAKHALELDKKEGKVLWKQAIDTEMKQIMDYETFRVLPNNAPMPPGYKRIPYHLVFDVKVDGRHKGRLVAGGHRTDPPKEDTYSGVVSLEAVRMGFLLADMNGLLVCAGDVGNAFLYGKTREKVYIIAGPEFGPDLEGKRLIIYKSLYGLKSSSARFHEHLSETLKQLGFRPSLAYNDLWMKECGDHYEYIARYVDDVIAFSKDPMTIMDKLKKIYIMKSVGTPEYYLGGNVMQLPEEWEHEGITTSLSAETYIDNVVPKLEKMVGKDFHKSRWKAPFDETYHAELDESELCTPVVASKYRSLIGSANWVVTLGRFDIAFATATLARYCMAPRMGHYEAAQRLFGYLKNFNKGQLFIDPRDNLLRNLGEKRMVENWDEFYPDAEEDLPPNMPKPLGKMASISVMVDADHARDKVTRRSVTGIVLFVNNTPMIWVTKRQKTVETSTYGAELVAGRMATETILEVRYKLRMLGIPLEKTSVLMGDNMSVILNTTLPSSVLKKKHNACAYHRIREAIAAGIIDFRHIKSEVNIADILTKPLGPTAFHRLLTTTLFRRPKTVTDGAAKKTVGMVMTNRD